MLPGPHCNCGEPWHKINKKTCKWCDAPLENEPLILATNIIIYDSDRMFHLWGDLVACSLKCFNELVEHAYNDAGV